MLASSDGPDRPCVSNPVAKCREQVPTRGPVGLRMCTTSTTTATTGGWPSTWRRSSTVVSRPPEPGWSTGTGWARRRTAAGSAAIEGLDTTVSNHGIGGSQRFGPRPCREDGAILVTRDRDGARRGVGSGQLGEADCRSRGPDCLTELGRFTLAVRTRSASFRFVPSQPASIRPVRRTPTSSRERRNRGPEGPLCRLAQRT